MTDFLDRLEAYHHWCLTGDCTHLERCQEWLITAVAIPDDETGWHQFGTHAIDWLAPLPRDWESNWRILVAA